ncbi:MAG: benzoyl-CoA reductase subunit A [Planctomycetes bacterium]|nr:benzoyl-CoA reductase subunit A [Planctomycetota bacterium]
MRTVIGIDLGSTTTKAVVLGEDGRMLGRGITNTRSNYDVACAIARSEALIATRFALLREALARRAPDAARDDALLQSIARTFRLEQHLGQIAVLRTELAAVASGATWHTYGEALHACAAGLLDRIEAEAPAAFAGGAGLGSEFFRDLVGARWRVLAEPAGKAADIGFDWLMSCFDKAIVRVENRALDLSFERFAGPAIERFVRENPALAPGNATALRASATEAAAAAIDEWNQVGTGYGRSKLPFRREQIRSEILCHGLGAHRFFPGTRTVLDIGGQDTKAIQVDDQGIVTSFQMNDRCAAGCGRYLGYIADEMNVAVQELGPMASRATRSVKINSTCTVFAGAELRDRLALGQKREDVVAGLHRAIVLRAMSLLARSGGVKDEFTFTGGVARNQAAVAALRQLVSENYGARQLNISVDSIYTGAYGAALFALRDARAAAATPDPVAA